MIQVAESGASELAKEMPRTRKKIEIEEGQLPVLWVKTTLRDLANWIQVKSPPASQILDAKKDQIRYLIKYPNCVKLMKKLGLERRDSHPELTPQARDEYLLAIRIKTFNFRQEPEGIEGRVYSEDKNESTVFDQALRLEKPDFEESCKRISAQWKPHFSQTYGSIRVFGLTESRSILQLYTHAKVWEEMLQKRSNLSLSSQADPQDNLLSRFNCGAELPKVSGWEIATKNSRLLVLGSPGIGKTMFMQYLLESCNQGNFLPGKIPVWIQLNRYAQDDSPSNTLLNYIKAEFLAAKIIGADVENLLKEGRLFIAMDGLDEVLAQKLEKVVQEIIDFVRQYPANNYSINCRSALNQYKFYRENFKEVEIADFDREQMSDCIIKWFNSYGESAQAGVAQSLIEALEQPINRPTKELAATPLLLGLICLIFRATGNLPKSRNEIFRRATDIFLQDWDIEGKGVRRDPISPTVSISNVSYLLESLAKISFIENQIFMSKDYILKRLKECLSSNQIILDSSGNSEHQITGILNGICLNHGFLVQRGFEIYTFNHLSFHEYFLARHFFRTEAFQELVEYGIKPEWYEVFFHCVEMPSSADPLLLLMLEYSFRAVPSNLQPFVRLVNCYVDEMSSEVLCMSYKPSALRAYLFSNLFRLNFDSPIDVLHKSGKASEVYSALIQSKTMGLDSTLDQDLQKVIYLIPLLSNAIALMDVGDLGGKLRKALANRSGSIMIEAILPAVLLLRLPDEFREEMLDFPHAYRAEWEQWWAESGEKWATDLLKVIENVTLKIEKYLTIIKSLTLIEPEVAQNYYNFCFLLAHCLNRAYLVSDSVRQQIEAQLLTC
ncbi:MAG: NACHT domain-containing protein [Oscillatoriophycideae cyanobacterium NC_groundwater_1537_Pr4_S-0.65um_50_18]|nr:NACHT domain-containing protein [Oscillatoriophycideae cyanobacterium NC_groundwater_1537_Pr4_S-0.65um_50_18]